MRAIEGAEEIDRAMSQHDLLYAAELVGTACPDWCVTDHEACDGEENWIHQSAPIFVTPDVTARLCISVDPESGSVDGPQVLIGDVEYSPDDARRLAAALLQLAATRP
jgi:hypothetical protein